MTIGHSDAALWRAASVRPEQAPDISTQGRHPPTPARIPLVDEKRSDHGAPEWAAHIADAVYGVLRHRYEMTLGYRNPSLAIIFNSPTRETPRRRAAAL